MRLHILGIGGTFMAGVALLARELGHEVAGSDTALYPPMSTQLEEQGVIVKDGYRAEHLDPAPDCVVIGNALSRGNPAVEAILDRGLRYTSGAQWVAEHVLADRWVLAVAGTHGKTTTASLLAWILEYAGLAPGFLIGGIPANFGVSARLGKPPFFVIEADEYDTAFFDKRSKFVHYRPRTAVLNNLEYDHADIFPNLAAIEQQFHHLVRTVPRSGLLVVNGADPNLTRVLQQGCWTPVERFGAGGAWSARSIAPDHSRFEVLHAGAVQGTVQWDLIGPHNRDNALAALVAARHAGVAPAMAIEALAGFRNAKRRLEVRGRVRDVTVYDDFAHHPTAIRLTLEGLRARVGRERIIAVLEPRSNTMRLGVHQDTLGPSLAAADRVLMLRPGDVKWDVDKVAQALAGRAQVCASTDQILATLERELRPADHVIIMSNGGFDNIHTRLLERLRAGTAR
ncbi:MAG: UDP-N-acetylmuramate:L-alanyl-gamma-D-glutamyl-meso-diaminopimelate ligase [Gammaproteobacteria bacterium]